MPSAARYSPDPERRSYVGSSHFPPIDQVPRGPWSTPSRPAISREFGTCATLRSMLQNDPNDPFRGPPVAIGIAGAAHLLVAGRLPKQRFDMGDDLLTIRPH